MANVFGTLLHSKDNKREGESLAVTGQEGNLYGTCMYLYMDIISERAVASR